MDESVLNFNVGVLGHIDNGKTSLARALSSVASTASFDKNPQSQERGITIDLGFSSFSVAAPARLQEEAPQLRSAHRPVHVGRLSRTRLAHPHHYRR